MEILGNVDDEITTDIKGNSSSIVFDHSLYKAKDDPAKATLNNVIKNRYPGFTTVNVSGFLPVFNFHIDSASAPGINYGSSTNFQFDLDDNPRNVGSAPDLGCYEKQ